MAMVVLKTKRSDSWVGFYYVNQEDINIGDIVYVPLRACNRSGARLPILQAKHYVPKGELRIEWQMEAGEFHVYPPDAFGIRDDSCTDLRNRSGHKEGHFFIRKGGSVK